MGDYSEVLQQMKKVIEDAVESSTATSESILTTITRRTIMTSEYTPQVGDRVGRSDWNGGAVTVTAIGRDMFLAYDDLTTHKREMLFSLNYKWVKVEPPPTYPERWINVYSDGCGIESWSRTSADMEARWNRIAVIHLAKDGTLTLHPDEVMK